MAVLLGGTVVLSAIGAEDAEAFTIYNASCQTIDVQVKVPGEDWFRFKETIGPKFEPRGGPFGSVVPHCDPHTVAGSSGTPPWKACHYSDTGCNPGGERADNLQAWITAGDFLCIVQLKAGGYVHFYEWPRSNAGIADRVPTDFECISRYEPVKDDFSTTQTVDYSPYGVTARPSDTVRFLATADIQFNHHNCSDFCDTPRVNEKADQTLQRLRDLKLGAKSIRGVVVAGDLVHTKENAKSEWDRYLTRISGAIRFFFDGLGNHDVGIDRVHQGVWGAERATRLTRRSSSADRPHYSWDWHDTHLVQLNVAPSEMGALDWLRDDLAAHVGGSQRPVVLIHHLGFEGFSTDRSEDTHWTNADQQAYWNVIKDYNVAAIIVGHVHLAPGDSGWRDAFPDPTGATGRRIPAFVAGATREGAYLDITIGRSGDVTVSRQKVTASTDTKVDACTVPGIELSGVSDGLLAREVTPTWTVSPASASVDATLDGAVWQSGDAIAAEGTHRLVVTADSGCRAEGAPLQDRVEVTFTIDRTPPTITVSGLPPQRTINGQSGRWTNADRVDGSITVTDDRQMGSSSAELDGVSLTSDAFSVSPEGEHRLHVLAEDAAGNTAKSVVAFTIDRTAPTISAARSPDANRHGWNNEAVTVSFSCADDAGSGVAACTSPITVSSEGKDQQRTGRARDRAGNTADATVTGINIDTTAPRLTAAQSPQPNGAGWNNTDVHVNFTCSDALSGLATCPADVDLSTEGEHTIGRSASDRTGNTASITVGPIRIDKTPPTITANVSPEANDAGWHNAEVTVGFTCADTLSGVSRCSDAVNIVEEGANQNVSGVAVDAAGNRATTAVTINLDRTPPTIQCSAEPGVLWPPNRKMRDVVADVDVVDELSGVARWWLGSVSSNQPDSAVPGDPPHDIQQFALDTQDLQGQLRAERVRGQPRHYRLRYRAQDVAGNSAACETTVTVPSHMNGSRGTQSPPRRT